MRIWIVVTVAILVMAAGCSEKVEETNTATAKTSLPPEKQDEMSEQFKNWDPKKDVK